jgi:hypothetical protein
MWLLIVVSVLYDHGNYTPVYSFRDFNSPEQCGKVVDWINHDRLTYGSHFMSVRAECLPLDESKQNAN